MIPIVLECMISKVTSYVLLGLSRSTHIALYKYVFPYLFAYIYLTISVNHICLFVSVRASSNVFYLMCVWTSLLQFPQLACIDLMVIYSSRI